MIAQNGRKKLFLSLARSSSSNSFLYSTGSKALMILLLLFNWWHDDDDDVRVLVQTPHSTHTRGECEMCVA
jgi:hypothetical protein